MSIKNHTREQLQERIRKYHRQPEQGIKLLFANEKITDHNLEQACALYAPLIGTRFDTVIVVERLAFVHDRLIPMISDLSLVTPFGEVPVNDVMRNEFCDEEDDFFIDDAGNTPEMCVYDHLMMLQCVLEDFSILSIQMAERRPPIIDEMAFVMSELLLDRHVLVVLCSDISACSASDLDRIRQLVRDDEISTLLNYCNSGDANMRGTGPFLAGIKTAREWELEYDVPDLGEPINGVPFMGGYAKLRSYVYK
jgi:AmmeMemoRadiSam system protein B